jgi:cytochrome c-type biogenesis protein CcmH
VLRILVSLLLFLMFLFSNSDPAIAQSGGQGFVRSDGYPSDDDVNSVAKKLYCPVCPNTPLDVCETKACTDWRAQIREQLADGWSQQQVMDYFVTQYGERVLAEPPRKGFTSLVWVFPITGTFLGGLLILHVLKNWRGSHEVLPAVFDDSVEVPPEILARLEKELQEMD